MPTLIILRHGESEWNLKNLFTGWTDVDLSPHGVEEARSAGRIMREAGLKPRFYFTSYLRRAIHTLQLAAAEMDREWVPVVKDWHLNERHYGALQGLDKGATARKYGDEQVRIWRRSYDVRPPQITPDDTRYPGCDDRYADLTPDMIPLGESLADTVARVEACWEEKIAPALRLYDTVLVAAHGNSLRALVMRLKKISRDDIPRLEIPTGQPWVFTLDDRLNVISEKSEF